MAKGIKELLFGKQSPWDLNLDLGSMNLDNDDGRFMNMYSKELVYASLQKYGVLKAVEEKGFHSLSVSFDLRDDYIHRALLYGSKFISPSSSSSSSSSSSPSDLANTQDQPKEETFLLIELNVRRVRHISQLQANLRDAFPGHVLPPIQSEVDNVAVEAEEGLPFAQGQALLLDFLTRLSNESSHPLDLVVIEWLIIQDPSLLPSRPLLPGQNHPGLFPFFFFLFSFFPLFFIPALLFDPLSPTFTL
jgi:hypothetical protein